MTSPVDTTVKHFRHDMPGAPQLTQAASTLISLLNACLIDGWGLQTATSVVVSGGVATATFATNHAASQVDAVVLVDGATPAGLNGEQKVIAVEPNKVKWATTEADGTATGTITVKLAPMGSWTKPYTGTNLAVYRSTHAQSFGRFLRVSDAAGATARVVGYENMTAVSTGTGPFPTNAQFSGGLHWAKSDVSGETVPWMLVGDRRGFHLCVGLTPGSIAPTYSSSYCFTDCVPFSPAGDSFATLLTGGLDASYGFAYGLNDTTGTFNTHFLPRIAGGTGAAIAGCTATLVPLRGALPNRISGAIEYSQVVVRDVSDAPNRAFVPGAYISVQSGVDLVQSVPYDRQTMRGGTRSYAVALGGWHINAARYALALDVTGPWR